jgi:Fe-Mn family superoxide dismutase
MNDKLYELPALTYGYEDLGPYISKDIMFLHHSKHHQTYVDKLNATIQKSEVQLPSDLKQLVEKVNELPDSIRQQIINFGGGHFNHSIFWNSMSPNANQQPTGPLLDSINAKYGSFQAFMDEFSAKALAVFGSGWTWLQPDLSIVTTPNQENPLMHGLPEPILGLDVWEHAYYLDYKNKRDDYIKAWWSVANWQYASDNFSK